MTSQHRMWSNTAAIGLAALGVFPGVALMPLLGAGLAHSGELWTHLGEMIWLIAVMALTATLFAGMILRAKEIKPRTSTLLLVLGAPAPSVAFFWLPPLYLLSVLVLIAALLSAPRRLSRIPAPSAL
jgi:hypothetical protein